MSYNKNKINFKIETYLYRMSGWVRLEKKDRRIQRTYDFLRRALIQLLQEDEINNISIKTLCETAGITRQTFYAHFENIADFIQFVSKGMLDDFRQDVNIFDERLQSKFKSLTTHQSIVRIFKHVLDHQIFYEAFLANNPTSPFALGFKDEIKSFITAGVNFVAPDDDQLFTTRDIVIEYATAGYFESVIWWIKNNYPYPIEKMAEMLLHISTHGPYKIKSK